MKRLILFSAVLLAMAVSGAAAPSGEVNENAFRTEAVSLARHQARMWDAAVENDWEGLYAQVLPQTREKVSLLQFMINPHYPAPLLGIKISGADTAPARDENAEAGKMIASGSPPPYKPPILSYRFIEMRFSRDASRAVVISNLSVAATQFLGPTSTIMPLYEFWMKGADGKWYADLAATTLIHTSGAATGHDPMEGLSVKVEPARFAAALVEDARTAAKDRVAELLEQALWLDVPETVGLAEKLHLGYREMLRSHLDRVYAGMWKSPGFFPVLMDAARWYLLIGEDGPAYDCYRHAAIIDMDSGPARAGAALTAARTGRWTEASAHYRHLLLLSAAAGTNPPPSLEPFLAPECKLCEKIPSTEGFIIAARLCNRGDYATAAAVYRFYAEKYPGFAEGLARLKRGEGLTLVQLVGNDLAREAAALTYHDATGVLHALGLRLTHPDDIPAGGTLPQGGVGFRSSLPLPQTDFSAGLFTSVIPAEGYISAKDVVLSQKLVDGGGWLLASMDGGKLHGAFHPDDAKGQNPSFAAAMGKIKKGGTVFAARVGSGPFIPDATTLKTLEAVGVDAAGLPTPVRNLVLAGVKGRNPGSARVFASDIGLLKKLDAAVNGGPGAVTLYGFGPSARIRLAR